MISTTIKATREIVNDGNREKREPHHIDGIPRRRCRTASEMSRKSLNGSFFHIILPLCKERCEQLEYVPTKLRGKQSSFLPACLCSPTRWEVDFRQRCVSSAGSSFHRTAQTLPIRLPLVPILSSPPGRTSLLSKDESEKSSIR